MKRTGPTNEQTLEVIQLLKTKARDVPAWKRLIKELERPTRHKKPVNLYRVAKHSREGEIVVVLGKLLAVGELDKPLTIAAHLCSGQAKSKVSEKKGKVISFKELVEQYPKAEKVRIIG